jgi:hypothetical protein
MNQRNNKLNYKMISKCTEEAYVGSNIYAFSYSFGYQISTSFQF